MTLNELKIGEEAVISKVGGEGELRLRLLDMGIIPHTHVKIVKVAPLGDPIQITVRGYELTIRRAEASEIEIIPYGGKADNK
ncbi:MAG: ferrous iron transport protein A [Eubacteriales bacterium]|nr:ferrous iron transport protein A [Eubacteriales bacterium]